MYYWVENLNVQSLSNFVYVSFVYINKTNKARRIYFIKFIFRWNSKKKSYISGNTWITQTRPDTRITQTRITRI